MKHIVTLTTSNPAHEHISLRRRQSTTNFMVEARDEQEAVLRASAHFRRLGHYIHEAKIFKKKDEQLNEYVAVARGVGAIARPVINAITQGGKSSLGKIFKDEVVNTGVSYGVSAVANEIIPSDKETSLGSIVTGRLGGGALSMLTRTTPKLPTAIKNIGRQTLPQVLGKIDLPPSRTDVPPSRPDVTTKPVPQTQSKPKPSSIIRPPDVDAKTKVKPYDPKPRAEANPKSAPPKGPIPPKSNTKTRPGGRRGRIRRVPRIIPGFSLPSLLGGDRPEVDPGTLGQYRGLFPIYNFADFSNLQEASPLNAIGRVMTKRKEQNKDSAESEKNKINMEPTLKSGKN